ncbi:hypothetical protein L873DRAFT_1789735 [Choiromyces venosus 120613-1]|uniref:Matrin-type domain-containing protein n=1 Tax=Choiromyces venosus 120613-1 TaxID=1336337 RepID=A0A3N4K0G3_9PEZI|nr:hypothetical protein L873DRAFT_1789735 [Choiromyces venosus 120613-1]
MSEYWKSTPRYYCKHCKMYVTDTPLSKKNHDASLKHQGNLKRFLRDLHRNNEREKNAAENAKREVARLNALAGGSSASASNSSSSSTTVARPLPPRQPAGVLTDAERKRQMKELESLGVALPDDYRAEMALMGEWKSSEEVVSDVPERKMTEKEKVQEEIRQDLKRKFDEEQAERKWKALDEDEKAIRSFKIETKSYPGMEDEDEGSLERLLKSKGKGKEVVVQREPEVKQEEADSEAGPKIKAEEPDSPPEIHASEENDGAATVVKKEEGTGVVFKKRRVKNIRKK